MASRIAVLIWLTSGSALIAAYVAHARSTVVGEDRQVEVALERAMELFRERGYEGSSTRELAQQMGIGAGSFYAAFTSKERLYEMTLARHRDEMTVAGGTAGAGAARDGGGGDDLPHLSWDGRK